MKVPFRHQVSNYDCTPTSIINGLTFLFRKEEIPPFVVQKIYKECLDFESSQGTSSKAVQDLTHFFSNYREKRYKNFALESRYLTGKQVHLKRSSKIIQYLNSSGVAVINIHMNNDTWHNILAVTYENEWLYCFDPSPRTKKFIDNISVQFISSRHPQGPNIRIRSDWIDKDFFSGNNTDENKFTFGKIDDRECLLLRRKSK